MKIIITGSLGYVSTPISQELIKRGHSVTIVTSNTERTAKIEAMGADAAIGVMEDTDFLTKTFRGADAVYCMLSSSSGVTDPTINFDKIVASTGKIADNYVEAIRQSGVKRVVYLSSVGAHLDKDNGLLVIHHNAEVKLSQLPEDILISFMRPVGFYKNLLGFVAPIKARGVIAANYGGDDTTIMVSPLDMATAITEELTAQEPVSRKVRYIASEKTTCNEVARILGTSIGKPDLKWIVISDDQMLAGMKASGMNESVAEAFVKMNISARNGKIYEDYFRNEPELGSRKLEEFAKEFAVAYNQ